MKCDELIQFNIKYEENGELHFAMLYNKKQVDEAIAELKAQNAELKQKLHTAEVKTDLTEDACMEYRENYKKLAESQRWRKYPEEKPDDGQAVWAYEADNNRVLTLEYEKTDEGEGFICFPYKQDFYTGVTHWMPYNKPKAPEVK